MTCCQLVGICGRLIQRVQPGGSQAALMQREAQASKSKASFYVYCDPTSGSSGECDPVPCRLALWHQLRFDGSCMSQDIPAEGL